MSTAAPLSRRPSQSGRSQSSTVKDIGGQQSQHQVQDPEQVAHAFTPCAATASFFLHAQGNTIFCLHHDTLAVERKFQRHSEDILLISVDNVSDRAGRLVASYDTGFQAIIWDLFTGDEVARFASYEPLYAATWMRDGQIAFGNKQGSVITFDPNTSEHVAARTIFDPITALAPAADCKTFAIGFLNGSILIATLQPFTILHTLNTSRGPSPISGLAWHGSSAKQKTDMLASQTTDGDLRVWSIAKSPATEQPRIIRILGAAEMATSSRSWFGWSKNGRVIQHANGETQAFDVRTKKVTSARVPTISEVKGISHYGSTATLFTVSPDQAIQQYDLNPNGGAPTLVAQTSHAPANAPPTPPDSAPRETPPPIEPPALLMPSDTSSEDEGAHMSPLQKIAQEMDQIEEEMRDRVGPLSPVSSRASSRNSMSSASSYGRRSRRHRERGYSSRTSDAGSEHTAFSMGSSFQTGRESVSIRSLSSTGSSRYHGASSKHQQSSRPQQEPTDSRSTDLFPLIRARLSEVKFRTPQFGSSRLTPDVLRNEMLSVVFGWEDDIEELVREELAHHRMGSASRVLLGKWLGDDGSDQMAQMLGSQSMTSTDWMLLAMTSQMGQGSQKQLGEAFVRRLLETDEVHSAAAILLGLNDPNEAVEAYVSRKFYMEAVLLTCLQFPSDWQRQSYLLRKWGEQAVSNGQAELAVRCFSCTSVDTSEPWFSPRAQNEVQAAQQSLNGMASPTSPPSAGPSSRIASKNASLGKLVTNFDAGSSKAAPRTNIGVTPIVDSAISPSDEKPWKRSHSRGLRDPSSARTATPGGYSRRRGPSTDGRSALTADLTPLVGARSRPGSRMSNKDTPATAVKASNTYDALPSPAPGVFNGPSSSSRGLSSTREASRDRNRHNLQLQMVNPDESGDDYVPATASTTSRTHKSVTSAAASSHGDFSPLMTDGSTRSFRGRNIDRYIDSLEAANIEAEQRRTETRSRNQSRDGRSQSRARARAGSQGEAVPIPASKRSPSSPAAMNTEDAFKHRSERNSSDAAQSPSEDKLETTRSRGASRSRGSSRPARREESPDDRDRLRSANKSAAARVASRSRNRLHSPEKQTEDRGREHRRKHSHGAPRSPSSPSPMKVGDVQDDSAADTIAARRRRQRSTSRPGDERSRARSSSRRPTKFTLEEPWSANPDRNSGEFPTADEARAVPRPLSRKELAQKELEERRQSLARRQPSVPPVPHPSEYSVDRPSLAGRSLTTESISTLAPATYATDPIHQRSRTTDPETSHSRAKSSGSAMPSIGLPATPRAMRHPRYMSADPDERDQIPDVPALPANLQQQQQQQHQQQAAAGAQEAQSPAIDGLGPLLPSSVYAHKGGPRSASAPPEQHLNRARSAGGSRAHARRPSATDAPEDPNVVVVADAAAAAASTHQPAVLPELQHLATPPPPPPPPAAPSPHDLRLSTSLEAGADRTSPVSALSPAGAAAAATATAPTSSRRGRTSISGASEPSSSTGGLWKNMRERMRNDSRSRAKSPPQPADAAASFAPSPYETKLPGPWTAASPAVASPAVGKGEAAGVPPLPPLPNSIPAALQMVQTGPGMGEAAAAAGPRKASAGNGGSMAGYRNPREIGRQFAEGGMI